MGATYNKSLERTVTDKVPKQERRRVAAQLGRYTAGIDVVV
jgi:hypothetical protein